MGSDLLRRLLAILGAVLLMVVLAACGAFGDSETGADDVALADGSEPRGVVMDPPVNAPDFELTSQSGEPYRLSEQRGDAIAIFFGYTGCPDICPLTLSFMSYATEQLDDLADNVQFLLVTVDPERDSPERLETYISNIDAPLTALTGSHDDLKHVWDAYDIAVERHEREDGNYLVDHSAQIWLVSPDGEVVMFLPMGADGDDLANDIRWMLIQRS